MRENREIPCSPSVDGTGGRTEKVYDRKSVMNEHGKSDSPILPAKSLNNAGKPAAEAVEGRGLTKENARQQNTCRTQGRENVSSALDRIRQAAIRNRKQRFSALFHHVTEERLKLIFYSSRRKASVTP